MTKEESNKNSQAIFTTDGRSGVNTADLDALTFAGKAVETLSVFYQWMGLMLRSASLPVK